MLVCLRRRERRLVCVEGILAAPFPSGHLVFGPVSVSQYQYTRYLGQRIASYIDLRSRTVEMCSSSANRRLSRSEASSSCCLLAVLQ
jgi:hypothetical protein